MDVKVFLKLNNPNVPHNLTLYVILPGYPDQQSAIEYKLVPTNYRKLNNTFFPYLFHVIFLILAELKELIYGCISPSNLVIFFLSILCRKFKVIF